MKDEYKYFLIGYIASKLNDNEGDADVQHYLQEILFDLEDQVRVSENRVEKGTKYHCSLGQHFWGDTQNYHSFAIKNCSFCEERKNE
jgi:hypothetical protein